MTASGSLVIECVQQLKASAHDYEKLLGSCVDSVWQTIGASVERQLCLRKGVCVPSLGKFAFVRDLQTLTPVFLLADRFASSYNVVWRRPPPALLTPVTDLNLSVLGNEAGALPKDQVQKALEALVAFIGTKLQKGVASGRLRVGNVGAFVLDGKAIAFHFDPGFAKAIVSLQNEGPKPRDHANGVATIRPRSSKVSATIPRAVSLQVLASVEVVKQPPIEQTAELVDDPDAMHHHRHKDRRHRRGDRHRSRDADTSERSNERHTKSIGSLSSADNGERETPGQILPRFMLPDPSRSPTKLVYNKQSAALERTFEFKCDELQRQHAVITTQQGEIDRRTDAARLRCVQERAEKTVNQRDLDAFLNMQIQSKHREQQRLSALDAASTDFDAVRVLPRDPIVTKEQRHVAKLKLRGRLHDQVALKESLAKQQLDVDRAESAYFMSKVLEQGERERDQRNELKRLAREVLTAGWQQQRAIKDECAKLR